MGTQTFTLPRWQFVAGLVGAVLFAVAVAL